MRPSLFAGGMLTVYFKSKVTILSFFQPGPSSAAPFILREEGFLVLGAELVQTGGDTFSSTLHPCKTSRINKCMALSCTGGL